MAVDKFINTVISQKNLSIGLTLFVLWLFFMWDGIGADRTFAVFLDNEAMLGPILASMSSALRNGYWPLRMDTVLGGFPLYNLAQFSPFYPFYFLILPIYTNPLDVMHSMHWVTIVHILILEINMYVFIRTSGASSLAAIIGSALVAFSANSLAYAPWVNITAPYAWFPLYAAGLIGILQNPLSKRHFVMTIVGMVLLTWASPAQPLIHAVLITGIFTVVRLIKNVQQGKATEAYFTIVIIGIVAVMAVLLTAPVIFPALFEYKDMVRWVGNSPPVVGNDRIPFKAFLTDQLSIADLGGVLLKFKSADVGSQYVGVITVALASLAVMSRPRSWLVLSLAFIAGYSLISATGSHLGLAYINYVIPLINKIREPSRFLVLFQFATGALAALGIDEVRNMVMRRDALASVRYKLILMTVIAVFAAITWLAVPEKIVSPISQAIPLAILVGLILLTWFISTRTFQGRDTAIALAWGSAALILLVVEVPWLPPYLTQSNYISKNTLSLDTALDRLASLDPSKEYRIIFGGKTEKPLAGMIASYHGLRTLNSFICPAPLRYFNELYYHLPQNDNYFRALGAKYLLCKDCPEIDTQGYSFLESVAGYEIYETKDVLPRSYIVHQLNGNFSDLADFKAKARTHNLIDKILYTEPEAKIGLKNYNDKIKQDCLLKEDIRTSNHSRFVLQCSAGGVLVLNEFFDKNWRITVDGIKKRIFKVNGNQIGARFTPGSHIIEFDYSPKVFKYSLLLMLIGIGLCLILFKKTDVLFLKLKEALINKAV
jgi:hypothetical protein